MLRLCPADRLLRTLERAHDIEVYSYTLQRGPVLTSLEAAARRGARVGVRLEGSPFPDRNGALAHYNRKLAEVLRRCGADATIRCDGCGNPPIHAKAIVADGRLFLDDRNFNAGDVIVADAAPADAAAFRSAVQGKPYAGKPNVAFDKRDAVDREAELLRSATARDDVVVVTETFGYGPVYSALDALAKRGGAPRLVVYDRAARANRRELAALAHLTADGVRVRLSTDSEKFALAGASGWIGSANASSAYPRPETVDWGARTRSRSIVETLRARAESIWNSAHAAVLT